MAWGWWAGAWAASRQRAQWDGTADFRLGPPPTGPVRLKGTFLYYYRAGDVLGPNFKNRTISVKLDSWIVDGRNSAFLDPPEVVDAALASPEFSAWLATLTVGDHNDTVLWFDPKTHVWQVGLLDYQTRRFHLALVDRRSGRVINIIDRPWRPKVDGFP